jgi:peroxiredoxin
MAQLRHDYHKFQNLNTEVLVLVPNGPKTIGKYVSANGTPYPVLSDKGSTVTGQYGIQTARIPLVTLFAPSVFVIDRTGHIRYANYSNSYVQEPDNNEPLAVLSRMTS